MKDYYIIQPLYLLHSTEDKVRFIHQKMKRRHSGQNRKKPTAQCWRCGKSPQEARLHLRSEYCEVQDFVSQIAGKWLAPTAAGSVPGESNTQH